MDRTVSNLSYHFVVAAKDLSGTGVILKCGLPGPEIESEYSALISFQGKGCVNVIRNSLGDGVLLLEEARPGASIRDMTLGGKDNVAIHEACKLIRRLQNPYSSSYLQSFKSASDFIGDFQKSKNASINGNVSLDLQLIARAEHEYRQMIETTKTQALLHGDLHHGNILSATREAWLAIDPNGIVGDPAYEVGAFIRNPMPELLSLPNVTEVVKVA